MALHSELEQVRKDKEGVLKNSILGMARSYNTLRCVSSSPECNCVPVMGLLTRSVYIRESYGIFPKGDRVF